MKVLKRILLVLFLLIPVYSLLYCEVVDPLAPVGAYSENKKDDTLEFEDKERYVFTYSGDDKEIKYSINIINASVESGLFEINAHIDDWTIKLIKRGGLRYRDSDGNIMEPSDFRGVYKAYDFDYEKVGNTLILKYQDKIKGEKLHSYEIEFHLVGKTLVFNVYTTDDNRDDGFGNYCGFSFDQEDHFPPKARIVEIPYAIEWAAIYSDRFFFSTYLDKNKSSASAIGPSDGVGEYKYPPDFIGPITENYVNLKGKIVPINETGYITVSNNIMDVLPNLKNPVSDYRDMLDDKVVLNIWDPGKFSSKEFIVARRWIAQDSGNARIYGNAHFHFPTNDDAVMLKIIMSNEVLWQSELFSQYNDRLGFDIEVVVEEQDEISFELHSHLSTFSNTTYFSPIIELNGKIYDSYDGYSLESGGEWSYWEKTEKEGKLVWTPLEPDERTGRWKSISTTNVMGRTWARTGSNVHFDQSRDYLKKLRSYGLKEVAVIFHIWQHFGYDAGLPKHWPPDNNGAFGGINKFRAEDSTESPGLVDTALDLGYLFAAHENYLFSDIVFKDYFKANVSEAELTDEEFDQLEFFVKDIISSDGETKTVPVKQFWEKYTISSEWMKYFASYNDDGSLGLKESGVNACFHDVITGNNPEATKQINLDPSSYDPDFHVSDGLKPSDSFKNVIENTKDLFNFFHEIFKGPLFGEGGYYWGRYDTNYAGYVDAVERQIEDGIYCKVIPDYELEIVRPLMANHGMGYYDRFFPNGNISDLNYNYDLYRATEIAFGHAGFIDCKMSSTILYPTEHQMLRIKEYYLMQQLQKQYLQKNVDVKFVEYENEKDGNFLSLDDALKWRDNDGRLFDFVDVRLRILYTNDLMIYVNRHRDSWDNEQINNENINLPPYGWYAWNPNSDFVAYTAKSDSNEIVDYVDSKVYTFAFSRNRNLTKIGDITTDGMSIINHNTESGRRDVCLLGGTILEYESTKNGILKIEEANKPCYLTLNYNPDNEDEFFLTIDSLCETFSVTYKDIPVSWKKGEDELPTDKDGTIVDGFMVVVDENGGGNLLEDESVKVSSPDGKSLKFEGLKPLVNYIVTINPQ